MYKHIKILEKYISASERNKSSHWKLFLNNKKLKDIFKLLNQIIQTFIYVIEKKKFYQQERLLFLIITHGAMLSLIFMKIVNGINIIMHLGTLFLENMTEI